MMMGAQLGILGIAGIVYKLQHRMKKKMSMVASKLIYWTTMLFVSATFNSMLWSSYPEAYNLADYFNIQTLWIVVGVLLLYLVIQLLAPEGYIEKLMKKFSKKKQRTEAGEEMNEHQAEVKAEPNYYLRESHFETFLETLCWLGFVATAVLGILLGTMGSLEILGVVLGGLASIVCLMMIGTVPIILRQILFYLYRIREIKEEDHGAELEQKFYHSLKKQNNRL